jgi:hypothetical protein
MKNTNGYLPAMPLQITDTLVAAMDNGAMETVERISGLTKREMFAMAATQGILASGGNQLTSTEIVDAAVRFADQLLDRLERSN